MRIPLRQAFRSDRGYEGRGHSLRGGRAATAASEGFAERGRNAAPSPRRSEHSRSDVYGTTAANLEERILRLTHRSSRLRFVRAGLARILVAGKGWTRLGFVRLGDYSRERLGLAARTLEEEAHVAWALERLPRTATAFLESGLSWTRVRLIASVACAATEKSWVEAASSCDTRSLEKRVRECRSSTPPMNGCGDSASSAPPAAPEDADVRFSVRVSREGRRLWRVACEMAERSAGTVLSQAQVLEHVVAEAASGAPLPRAEQAPPGTGDHGSTAGGAPSPPAGQAPPYSGDRGSTVGGAPSTPAGQAPPHSGDRGSAGQGAQASESGDGPRPGTAGNVGETTTGGEPPGRPAFTGAAAMDPANFWDHDPELAAFLESCRAEDARGADCPGDAPACEAQAETPAARIARHLDDIARTEDLHDLIPRRRGSSTEERLEAIFDSYESRDPFLLDKRIREIGLAMQRIDAELGLLLNTALENRLHRELGFRNFADFVTDRLGFCPRKAWTLVAIERATSRHCGEFAEAYREGRLSLLAARALLPVMGSRHGREWIARAGLVTLRRLEAEVAWALDRRDAASAAADFEALAPPPLDHDLRADTPTVLDRDELQMRAHGDAATPEAGRVQMRAPVDLRFLVPREVAALAEDTMLALRRESESRGAAFERMLATVLLEWTSAPGHRDPVFERDGWRCAVPACSSRRNLHDHHILFRSLGGDNGRDNRVTVCAAHHLHGLHSGRIRARGRAPSDIFWDLGCRPAAERPLARLLGDRYLEGR